MDIQYLPYDPQYNTEIVHCLQRNYPWMGRRSEAEILAWARPILEYHHTLDYEYRYAHGLLMLDGQRVVGFLGNITSLRDGIRTVNWTTWAVDADYRFYSFAAIMTMLQAGNAEVYTDLTASPTVQAIDARFGFHKVSGNTVQYRVPQWKSEQLQAVLCTAMDDAAQITSEELRTAYLDHLPYDVRCIVWDRQGRTEYLFVKRYRRKVAYGLLTEFFVRILESSVPHLDRPEMDALLRYVARSMRVRNIECDDAILACPDASYVRTMTVSDKMYRTENGTPPSYWSYLYSELALLDE